MPSIAILTFMAALTASVAFVGLVRRTRCIASPRSSGRAQLAFDADAARRRGRTPRGVAAGPRPLTGRGAGLAAGRCWRRSPASSRSGRSAGSTTTVGSRCGSGSLAHAAAACTLLPLVLLPDAVPRRAGAAGGGVVDLLRDGRRQRGQLHGRHRWPHRADGALAMECSPRWSGMRRWRGGPGAGWRSRGPLRDSWSGTGARRESSSATWARARSASCSWSSACC